MRNEYTEMLILVICKWWNFGMIFFFPLHFEFSKYSTENTYNWTKRTILLFSETKAPLPLQCGSPAKTLLLDSISERALRMLLGSAARPVIYGNLPWGWPHHWNLCTINPAVRVSRDCAQKPSGWSTEKELTWWENWPYDLKKSSVLLWPVPGEGLLSPTSTSSR